jgi:elongation factor Ts
LGLFDKVFDVLKDVDGEVSSFEELDASLVEKINTLIAEAVGSIGENMKVGGLHITSENAYAYSHPGDKVVSLVYYTGDEAVAKELALQVAALDPDYLTFDEVPAEEKEKLKAEFTEELKKQGKPENMIENIVKGKINKAFADVVLLEQEYIRDGAKKVKEVIPAGFEIKKFYRFAI